MFMEDFEDFEEMRWKKHLEYTKKSYLALLYQLKIITELADASAKPKKDDLVTQSIVFIKKLLKTSYT